MIAPSLFVFLLRAQDFNTRGLEQVRSPYVRTVDARDVISKHNITTTAAALKIRLRSEQASITSGKRRFPAVHYLCSRAEDAVQLDSFPAVDERFTFSPPTGTPAAGLHTYGAPDHVASTLDECKGLKLPPALLRSISRSFGADSKSTFRLGVFVRPWLGKPTNSVAHDAFLFVYGPAGRVTVRRYQSIPGSTVFDCGDPVLVPIAGWGR